jgi:hypothetical protein
MGAESQFSLDKIGASDNIMDSDLQQTTVAPQDHENPDTNQLMAVSSEPCSGIDKECLTAQV